MTGFTLIELIGVLILIGILAAVTLPRLAHLDTFASRGFHDATLAALRHAQKTAITQRRTVCVAFTTSSLALTLAGTAGSATCTLNFDLPGESDNILQGGSAAYAASPSDFSFNAAGRPSLAQQLQVSGLTQVIRVEAETGYVHD